MDDPNASFFVLLQFAQETSAEFEADSNLVDQQQQQQQHQCQTNLALQHQHHFQPQKLQCRQRQIIIKPFQKLLNFARL